MNSIEELFWDAPVAAMKQGYLYEAESDCFVCLLCGEKFEQGQIYSRGDLLLEAKKAVKDHLAADHVSLPQYLLSLDKKITGLTDTQKDLLLLALRGMTDKEVAMEMGTSASTVRNHRFNLRQKEKQARVFLAIMELLKETKSEKKEDFMPIHRRATMVDERFAITEKEYDDVLKFYFPDGPDGMLKEFPRKEKRKIIILSHLAEKFSHSRRYTEKEVNEIIKKVFDDYVTLRRYLIEYGFLDREKDCSSYWVKQ